MQLLVIDLVQNYMLIELLEIGALLAVLILPVCFPYKGKANAVKFPKNYPDTSEANYAINEHGFLEGIKHDNIESDAK